MRGSCEGYLRIRLLCSSHLSQARNAWIADWGQPQNHLPRKLFTTSKETITGNLEDRLQTFAWIMSIGCTPNTGNSEHSLYVYMIRIDIVMVRITAMQIAIRKLENGEFERTYGIGDKNVLSCHIRHGISRIVRALVHVRSFDSFGGTANSFAGITEQRNH
jgi:hypothetical protein